LAGNEQRQEADQPLGRATATRTLFESSAIVSNPAPATTSSKSDHGTKWVNVEQTTVEDSHKVEMDVDKPSSQGKFLKLLHNVDFVALTFHARRSVTRGFSSSRSEGNPHFVRGTQACPTSFSKPD
jgi:hypothetical protein